MERPDVDVIQGLSPSIAIEQKTTLRSPRSTVGTITEIYDYLRVIYASVGVPHCPSCGKPITRHSSEQVVQAILAGELCQPDDRVMILAPIVRGRKGAYRKELEKLAQDGFVRVRVNGELFPLDNPPTLDKRKNHTIEVVIDRLLVKQGIATRLEQSIATALKLAGGLVTVAIVGGKEHVFSEKLACPDCGISVPQLEPRSFSFNSPYGACPACNGLGSKYDFDAAKIINDWSRPLFDGGLGPGSSSAFIKRTLELAAYAHGFDLNTPFDKFPARIQNLLLYGYPPSNRRSGESADEPSAKAAKGEKGFRFPGILKMLDRNFQESTSDSYREWMTRYMSATLCSVCHGKRLRPESLAVKLAGFSIADFTALSLSAAREAVGKILSQLGPRQKEIAARPLEEVGERLEFLLAVGLSYLSLDRSAATLSGGVICLANLPFGCAPGTTTVFSARSNSSAISATPFWSSSTMKTPFAAPISSSISVPAQAMPGAISSPRANPSKSPPAPNRSPDATFPAPPQSPFQKSAAAPTANPSRSSALPPTI